MCAAEHSYKDELQVSDMGMYPHTGHTRTWWKPKRYPNLGLLYRDPTSYHHKRSKVQILQPFRTILQIIICDLQIHLGITNTQISRLKPPSLLVLWPPRGSHPLQTDASSIRPSRIYVFPKLTQFNPSSSSSPSLSQISLLRRVNIT